MPILALLGLISGYKTYIGVGLGILSVIANATGHPIPGVELDSGNAVSDIFKMLMLATVRHGISKIGK